MVDSIIFDATLSYNKFNIFLLNINNLINSLYFNIPQVPQGKAIRPGSLYQQEIYYNPTTGQFHNPQFQQQQQQLLTRSNFQTQPAQTLGSVNPATAPLVRTPGIAPTPPTPPTTTLRTPSSDESNSAENIPNETLRKNPKLITTQRPRVTTPELSSDEVEDQAKSAYYNFGTEVKDTINDHEHTRQETREGLKLTGMYSYSDGFFKRTVHYVADEGGYRVTKEEVTPITGTGPKFNPKGTADVKNTLSGDYSITVNDFKLNKEQEKILKQNGTL